MSTRTSPGFTVIGVAVRTTNGKEMSGRGIIGKLWERVMEERLSEKIPNRADSSIIALYTDYDSDAHGEYTFLVGAKVASDLIVPEGMEARHIPDGNYSIFESEKGPVWVVVPETWQKVWAASPAELGGQRTYFADFEVYDGRAADPADAVVEVWVGIR